MIRQITKLIFLLSILLHSSHTIAQSKDLQWWGNYTYHQTLHEQWQVSMRIENRYLELDKNDFRAGISPKVVYDTQQDFEYIVGSRFFYYDTASKDGVMEYRPWLGLKYAQPSPSSLSLSHQVRWEHRIYNNETSYESRMRYKFKVGTTLFKAGKQALKVAFSPELFWSLGVFDDATYKNTRWGFPVSYQYNENLVMEVVPFLQTNHDGMLNPLSDESFGVIQLNLKTFL